MAINSVPPSSNQVPSHTESPRGEPATQVVQGESLTRPGQHFVLRYPVETGQSSYVSRPHANPLDALLGGHRHRPSGSA